MGRGARSQDPAPHSAREMSIPPSTATHRHGLPGATDLLFWHGTDNPSTHLLVAFFLFLHEGHHKQPPATRIGLVGAGSEKEKGVSQENSTK